MALIIGSRYDTFGEFEYIVLELNDGMVYLVPCLGWSMFVYVFYFIDDILSKKEQHVCDE